MPDDTRFPRLRSAMDAPYSELSDDALGETIPFLLPGVSAEDAEGFFDTVTKAFGQVAKVVQQNPMLGRVLTSAATGGATGLVGGPLGALAGASAGALGALLGGSGGPAGVPLPAGGGGGIARQIAGVLTRPETWNAITQMAVPGSKQTVSVGRGGIQVPTSSFAQLLGFLGNRLAEDAEDVPGPTWPPPSAGIDLASPADRAGALLSLLALTQPVALPAEPGAAAPATVPSPVGSVPGIATAQPGEPGTAEEPLRRAPRRRLRMARPADEAADEAVAAADLEAAALLALARELAS